MNNSLPFWVSQLFINLTALLFTVIGITLTVVVLRELRDPSFSHLEVTAWLQASQFIAMAGLAWCTFCLKRNRDRHFPPEPKREILYPY